MFIQAFLFLIQSGKSIQLPPLIGSYLECETIIYKNSSKTKPEVARATFEIFSTISLII